MCISKLKDFKVRLDENKEGIGWKVFEEEDHYKPNVWYQSSNVQIPVFSSHRNLVYYPSGFHVYQFKKDAKEESLDWGKLKKVKFKNVVATGLEEGKYKVIVAKEMMIMEN